ncbi:hypothetical protein MXB_4415, partial [Myxobolus squamalis]
NTRKWRQDYIKHHLDEQWLKHKSAYKLNFPEPEEINRKAIFLKNFAFITESNRKNKNYTLKMNSFGHLERKERAYLLLSTRSRSLQQDPSPIFVGKPIELELDWRSSGVVSSVKNQSKCASCYAFSSIDAIESQFAIHTGVLPDLSKQEIVDCTWNLSNYGCYGGYPEHVYEYCMENGISTSLAYPYRGRNMQCNRNNPNSSYKLTGYQHLTEGDEDNLLRALNYVGPISIGVDGSSDIFIFYSSGIIDFSLCSSNYFNHAVLAVGYNLHRRPYLLVKNR